MKDVAAAESFFVSLGWFLLFKTTASDGRLGRSRATMRICSLICFTGDESQRMMPLMVTSSDLGVTVLGLEVMESFLQIKHHDQETQVCQKV